MLTVPRYQHKKTAKTNIVVYKICNQGTNGSVIPLDNGDRVGLTKYVRGKIYKDTHHECLRKTRRYRLRDQSGDQGGYISMASPFSIIERGFHTYKDPSDIGYGWFNVVLCEFIIPKGAKYYDNFSILDNDKRHVFSNVNHCYISDTIKFNKKITELGAGTKVDCCPICGK